MNGTTITVAQQKGGSGKTTLAANLAIELLGRGYRVAVLDTDPQGSLGRWFMTRRARTANEPGLEFATSSAWGVGYECEKLKKNNDFVIIDTPPKIDSDLRPALRESDLVLVPVATSHMDLWATESVLEMVERVDRPVLLVLNRASSRANLTTEVSAILDGLSVPRAATVLGNRVIFAEVLGEGLGVTEKTRGGVAAAEISALTDEVLAVLALN
ncbi:ParA family partition ATPase [Pseudoruegeria sp. SK021]|uniref:ParA family partition ATPase n=1 Tax=Pseudoruegeria sp. SK021 TaxID=1933035 RepID=UPI000A251042|nr:ParA family partition ATPase [Pseudoruegeria sp. SK021]OSP56722.1 cobyrinic acid a,c-diamide synthase [Pseudoruegeria sp. SK021]